LSNVEREYIKSVDEVILKASGKTLKKLQELDMKTQLHADTFYDAYSSFHEEPKKEKIPSTTKSFRKNKP
jgi:glycerol-3-phosphate cytidylyltransferase-like family protein